MAGEQQQEQRAHALVAGDLVTAAGHSILAARTADVGLTREAERQRRLQRLAWVLVPIGVYMWWRILSGNPMSFGLPHLEPHLWIIIVFFSLLILLMGLQFYGAGRSPHVMFDSGQIDTRLDDVKGVGPLREEVVRSINLFLAHKTFAAEMGGTPRRGLLFEGPPGTGKTLMAKAMARETGVPFLFVSATAFQSMFYGATARRIRSYFKKLRKVARRNGGAIGFIEEIDAIGGTRAGMAMTPAPAMDAHAHACWGTGTVPSSYAGMSASAATVAAAGGGAVTHKMVNNGTEGVVNELLVQMQSFDQPTGWQVFASSCIDALNAWLPASRQVRKPKPKPVNVLVIAATNRAANLDPALVRPGRFDRKLTFDLPSRAGRREILEFYLAKKAHDPALDTDESLDLLSGMTLGYSPVMIEHLLDEALVSALRRGDTHMTLDDIEKARLAIEIGIGQPVTYTDHEKRLIATHEAGHAVTAFLVAPTRRLEVLSIIKRKDALGMLAHNDSEEVWTRSRSEMLGFIQISMGGQVAEELFFGDVSTGPSGDLLFATNVAAQMVGAAGMMHTLVSYAAVQNGALADTNIVGRVLADTKGRAMVEEVLQDQKVKVRGLLEQNAHLVEALRDALLERNELIGPEITDVLRAAQDGAGMPPQVIDLRDPADVDAAPAQLDGPLHAEP